MKRLRRMVAFKKPEKPTVVERMRNPMMCVAPMGLSGGHAKNCQLSASAPSGSAS